MKTIGIVAVTSEGASDCYKSIVKLAFQRLGDYRHPQVVLVSPPFNEIHAAELVGDWDRVAQILADAANRCVAAGADFIIIPSNTPHYAYPAVVPLVPVPVVSIVDTVARACQQRDLNNVGVLGTQLTMTQGLYTRALADADISQVFPPTSVVEQLNTMIIDELILGIVRQTTVAKAVSICQDLADQECGAIILACTELNMVLNEQNCPLPLLDSTMVLAEHALNLALTT